MRKSGWLLTSALALAFGQTACTTGEDGQMHADPMAMAGAHGDWTVYGGDLANTRYAASDQINASNVQDLRLKWIFQTGIIGSFQATPIVEDGVMYVTTPYNHVFAVDASTGRELWHYEHKLGTTIFCCGPNNRGVALADDKVYMATLDALLIALDKKTGELLWESEIADPEFGYSETVAPTVYEDKIILGISGAEYGIRGFISAYDKETGDLIWRWHTIPAPDEVQPDGTRGWYGDFRERRRHQPAQPRRRGRERGDRVRPACRCLAARRRLQLDDQRDRPRARPRVRDDRQPSPDLYAEVRPGDNRWTESLVALDVDTGELKWGYQYVPHDPWDLDAASPPILAEVAG